jgi:nitrogen fixation protein NifU and related proteins
MLGDGRVSSISKSDLISMTYSEKVLEHFQNPRNVGELAGADAQARVENPVCGDIMDLAVKLSGGRIDEVRYRIKGCVPSIAAGSCLTEMIKGRSLSEVRSVKREELVQALDGLPKASLHASHLAMDALAAVLKKLPPK